MSFASVWRGWRAKVHDILEVGDGNPIGRVVNVFLIVLIIANGLAFAAETVSSVYERWGPELEAFNIFSVLAFTVEYVLRLWSSIEIPLYRRMPYWRARLNFALTFPLHEGGIQLSGCRVEPPSTLFDASL